ncbi:MAG: ECF transporter S component [Firmicutes bacterium]|nr:ECF transporter S component [Bacillota bacterium]
MKRNNSIVKDMTVAALCLAIALVLPFLTGQIPTIGSMISPMHIPVYLCAFFCSWQWAALMGFTAPLLRYALFSMPPMPFGIAMAFEMAAYGAVTALVYSLLPRRKKSSIYISMVIAMVCGRAVWGAARMIIAGVTGTEFTWSLFMAGAFVEAIPGIIIHLVLVPVIVMAVKRKNL